MNLHHPWNYSGSQLFEKKELIMGKGQFIYNIFNVNC
jgi:hypothetical protein